MFMSVYAGNILASVGNYTPIFLLCSMACRIALGVIHPLTPRMDRGLTDPSVPSGR